MESVEDIGEEENLGRGVSSSNAIGRSEDSRAKHHVFLPKRGVIEISVDRLCIAGAKHATAIAINRDRARERKFYGWWVVTAEEAAREGRYVVASPNACNPYHADIVLPQHAAEDREEQIHHAQELADSSRWLGAIK